MAKQKRKKSASKHSSRKARGKRRVQGAAARKKAATRGGRKAVTKKKAAKRSAAKRKAKKQATKARAKRTVRKEAAPRLSETAKELVHEAARMAEARMVVDIVGEPAPGVLVVTEYEAVQSTKPPEDDEGSD